MVGYRVGVSAVLGVLVTLSLVFVMFKLIDSGNKDMDEQPAYKSLIFFMLSVSVQKMPK